METLTQLLDRAALVDRYRAGRARSAQLFASIAPSAYYEAPIPLRHPFVFYEGHLPAFAFLVLHERALEKQIAELKAGKSMARFLGAGFKEKQMAKLDEIAQLVSNQGRFVENEELLDAWLEAFEILSSVRPDEVGSQPHARRP